MRSPSFRPIKADIHFEPLLRAKAPETRQDTIQLADALEAHEKAAGVRLRVRREVDRRNFRIAVEALVCNLCRWAAVAPNGNLAVPRGHATLWKKGANGGGVYGQHFLDAIDLMANQEPPLLERVGVGLWASNPVYSSRSSIKPTLHLTERFPALGVGSDSFRLEDDHSDVLILRGKKDANGNADDLAFTETGKTKQLRKAVERINAYLLAVPIIIVGEDPFIGLTESGQPIDPNRRRVRRIFNNGSWQQGGRLYDGFWETMPRPDRGRLLRIATEQHPEGEPVKNIDFGQLFPRLAYFLADQPAPEGDLYEIPGNLGDRDGWKKLTNALLFATSPLIRWPLDCRPLFGKDVKLRTAVEALKEKHRPIAHRFETGIGYRLMFIESTILVD